MATDYDAPRKNEEEQSEESIEELKARRHDKNSGKVDEDEAEAAESFELPGADLSHEELAVEVQAPAGRRVHLHELLPGAPPQPARGREEADLQGLRLSTQPHGASAATTECDEGRDPVAGSRPRSSSWRGGASDLDVLAGSGGRCPVERR